MRFSAPGQGHGNVLNSLAGDLHLYGLRIARMRSCVDSLCESGLKVVDRISSLESSNLDILEAMIERYLKMLHCCNSLATAVDHISRYPQWSVERLIAYADVFDRALIAVQVVEILPNRRIEDLRGQRIRVMKELMHEKVKVMVSIAKCIEVQLERHLDPDIATVDSKLESTNSMPWHGAEQKRCKLVARMEILLSRTAGRVGKYLD